MNNEKLRQQVKLLKVYQNISYKEIAEEYLDISSNSFYHWLNGYYDFGINKLTQLKYILETLTEE